MMENIEIKTPREYKIRKIERLNNRYEFFYPSLLRLFYSPMISTLYSVSKHIGNSNAVLVSAVIYFIIHIVTNLIVDNKYRAQADLSRLQMEINVEDAKSYEEARDVVQNALDEMNKKIKKVENIAILHASVIISLLVSVFQKNSSGQFVPYSALSLLIANFGFFEILNIRDKYSEHKYLSQSRDEIQEKLDLDDITRTRKLEK